jgi:hypothetical protein
MTRFEGANKALMFVTFVVAAVLTAGVGRGFGAVGSGVAIAPGTLGGAAAEPSVISSSPTNLANDIPTRTNTRNNLVIATAVTATFSQPMDRETVNVRTFTVRETDGNEVAGMVVMNEANTVAIFRPISLSPGTSYTGTVTTEAKSAAGIAMANPVEWTFTTDAAQTVGQAPVRLGRASSFAILTKTGITDVFPSAISGDVGASPISGAAIHLTCAEKIVGTIYSVNAAGPLPCRVTAPAILTTAVANMEAAYNDAAGRKLPDFVNLGAGKIGGLTLTPGLYNWTTAVSIATDVTLKGGPNAVWIFQIAGNLVQASATHVILKGGALARNIIWQTAGAVAIGTTAHFEGVILAKTKIAMKTSASANSRLLAQTAVTLQKNTIKRPGL